MAIKGCYILAGFLFLLNIHFSAMALNDIGIENGVTGISNIEALMAVYVPSIFVSAYCFLAVGFLSHPMGIPAVLGQIQVVQKQVKTPLAVAMAYLVSVGVLGILMYWLFSSYKFDIYTTQIYLGTQDYPLLDHRSLPTWAFIAGPEVIMVFGNGLNILNGGKQQIPTKMKSANVQQPVQQVANVKQPQPKSPQGRKNPWSSL